MEIINALFAKTMRKSGDGVGIDIIGIFDGITSESFPYWNPGVRPLIGYTLNWNDNNQKFDLTFRVIDEDGNNIVADAHSTIVSNIPLADGKYRTDWLMFDFPERLIFPKPGRYRFDTMLDEQVLKSVYISFVDAKTVPRITVEKACFGEVGEGPNGPVPINVFNSVEVERFPSELRSGLSVYIEAKIPYTLIGSNKGVISAQLFNSRTNKRIAGYNTTQLKPDDTPDKFNEGAVEMVLNLFVTNPKFQNPGGYEARIIVDNEVLFRLPLDVRQKV